MNDNAELLDEFCDALWLEDGLSRNSLDSYRRDLRIFSEWLAESRHQSLIEAGHSELLAYLAARFQNSIKIIVGPKEAPSPPQANKTSQKIQSAAK